MQPDFGQFERFLGILLEEGEQRYTFKVDSERKVAFFTAGGMQAVASIIDEGLFRVVYESALHEVAEEFCTTPKQAATLIAAVMARKELFRVAKPEE